MGCAPSIIDDESISRCKDRKLLLKQALSAHTAFSAAHKSYATALCTTALSLRRYAHGEANAPRITPVRVPHLPALKHLVLQEQVIKTWHNKLKRSVLDIDSTSTPKDEAVLKGKRKRYISMSSIPGNGAILKETVEMWDFFLQMNTPEEDEQEEEDNEEKEDGDEELVFVTPEFVSKMEEEENPLMNSETEREEIRTARNAKWLEALEKIHDQFMEASECAREVWRFLESKQCRFLHNDEDFRAMTVDHAVRVLRVITWNQPGTDSDSCAEVDEPNAVVLDKLIAWETKLYNEVKAFELMKREYQRKVMLLAKQKKGSASSESLEKTKAVVRHMHNIYKADMQLMLSTVSEVNSLRDHQLCPKLVEMVSVMAKMWEDMSMQHENQLRIVSDLKFPDISGVPGETTWGHYKQTTKFLSVVEGWQTQFDKLVAHQKSYVSALNSWLKLNLIPMKSNLKEKLSSSSRNLNPPIQLVLISWHECIDKIPGEPVAKAISSFAATMKIIVLLLEEEMELKDKREETRKEYERKCQEFENWLHKHTPSAPANTTDNQGASHEAIADKELALERLFVVESLNKRLDKEIMDHRKHCVRVREKSIRSLRIWLPEIFRAITDYAHACANAYNRVKECIPVSENPTNVNIDPC